MSPILFNEIFGGYLPEIVFSVIIMLQLLVNSIVIRKKNVSEQQHSMSLYSSQTIFILLGLLILYIVQLKIMPGVCVGRMSILINTSEIIILKIIIVCCAVFVYPAVIKGLSLQKINMFEYYTLFLVSVLASLFLVSANDFLVLFMALEIQAFSFYALIVSRRKSTFSTEAGVKYFIFGSVGSGVLLFALSILYSVSGTLQFIELAFFFTALSSGTITLGMKLFASCSIILIAIALLFKLGCAPFHFWVPDVYEGAPIATTIAMSVFPKIALFHLLVVIKIMFFDFIDLGYMFLFFGAYTLLFGAYLAFEQERIKRFFICSSISQIGFPVILLGVGSQSVCFTYFFLFVYLVSAIGMWILYVLLYSTFKSDDDAENFEPLYLTDLSGLKYFSVKFAFFVAAYFFFLSGLPPFAVFFSKALVILAAMTNFGGFASFLFLIVALIPAFYYLRVIKALLFDAFTVKTFHQRPVYRNSSDSSRNILPRQDALFYFNCFILAACFFYISFFSYFFFEETMQLCEMLMSSNYKVLKLQ